MLTTIVIFAMVGTAFGQSAAEYKVYSAVIEQMFVGGKVSFDSQSKVENLLIRTQTASNLLLSSKGEDWREVMKSLPTLLKETVDDYEAKPKNSDKLTASFKIGLKYQLFTNEEYDAMFEKKGANGWGDFYKQYPNTGGYISFSRVGFDKPGKQALVYFQHSCGSLCATGFYILLVKSEENWKVADKRMLWIS